MAKSNQSSFALSAKVAVFGLAITQGCLAEVANVSSKVVPKFMSPQPYHSKAVGLQIADYWVSEKLDGVRAIWDGQSLRFKSGRMIPAPAWFVAGFPSQALDGELWLGRQQFEKLSGIVRRQEPNDDEWRLVSFNVFDVPNNDGHFADRLDAIRRLVGQAKIPWLQAVGQFQAADETVLKRHLQAVIAQGGEGLVLHKANSFWMAGRSDDLLKMKPIADAEATIVGYEAGQGRLTGRTGALIVRLENGKKFRIGSGLSDADRQSPPPLGTQITYRYRGLTNSGIPRFATFWRVRGGD